MSLKRWKPRAAPNAAAEALKVTKSPLLAASTGSLPDLNPAPDGVAPR